jgi:tetratricopeptide (TPR) repeat protein
VRRLLQALLLGFSLATTSNLIAGKTRAHEVRDLHYGEVLFHFYQQDYFTAITHLMAARQRQLLEHHRTESGLLLGGLQLSYGLLEEADKQFRTLLGPDSDPELRDRIWYYLTKISHQRGFHDKAYASLKKIATPDDKALQADIALLGANIRMALGQNMEAAEDLKNVKAPEGWEEYLNINRGIALLRAGEIEKGRAVLDNVGTTNTDSDELKALRDRANLGLGYELLRAGDSKKAREFLSRVRLRGPFMQAALLGAGWADAEQGNFENALTPWLTLIKLASFDPPVQEAHLAVPYALTRLGDQKRAIYYYDHAIRYYDDEQAELEKAINSVESGALLSILSQVDTGESGGWLRSNATLSDVPAGRYLVDVLSGHDFQEELKNYRDLGFLETVLDEWLENIEIYYDMVDTRRQAYAQRAPVVRERLKEGEAFVLERKWQALQARLQEQMATTDPLGLANSAELQQWEKLDGIRTTLAQLPAKPRYRDMLDRAGWLQGILYWQIQSDYKTRLWNVRKQLKELEQSVQDAANRRKTLAGELETVRAGFDGYDRKIDALRARIRNLLPQIQTARGNTSSRIERLAQQELETRKQRIVSYRNQARYALARGYDQLAGSSDAPP